jgi:hypothetical protein
MFETTLLLEFGTEQTKTLRRSNEFTGKISQVGLNFANTGDHIKNARATVRGAHRMKGNHMHAYVCTSSLSIAIVTLPCACCLKHSDTTNTNSASKETYHACISRGVGGRWPFHRD